MVAMAIGFLYKRFVVGAKGWEQVPLLEFYQEFGNLEAVSNGCLLSALCVTLFFPEGRL